MPKISEFTADTAPDGADLVAVVDTSAGTTDKVTLTNLAASSALAGQYASVKYGARRKIITGSWSVPQGPRSTGGGNPLGRAGFVWLDAAPGQDIDRMAIEVTTGGGTGAVVRLGIYTPSATDGSPDALLLDAGTVDGESTGTKEITVAQELPGPVWLVAVPQGAINPICRTLTQASTPFTGVATTLGQAIGATGRDFPYVGADSLTGALPATLTYGGSLSTVAVAIAVSVRFA